MGKDLMEGLVQRYVRRVVLEDPEDFKNIRETGAIFVGNHQVQIESLLVTHILAGLTQTPFLTMANAKHETRWIGWLLERLAAYPGNVGPSSIVYFDQQKPDSMFEIMERLREHLQAGQRSFFVHSQGTRARSCRDVTDALSSVFLDLAIEQDLPIVPVRFKGGLPIDPIEGKLEFPTGHGRQDYIIGKAISAAELAATDYARRRDRVLNALNELGGSPHSEDPQPADPSFAAAVASWSEITGANEVEATFFRILQNLGEASELTRTLVQGAQQGSLVTPSTAEGQWLAEVAVQLFGPKGPKVMRAP
jgi:hypothetical protein